MCVCVYVRVRMQVLMRTHVPQLQQIPLAAGTAFVCSKHTEHAYWV